MDHERGGEAEERNRRPACSCAACDDRRCDHSDNPTGKADDQGDLRDPVFVEVLDRAGDCRLLGGGQPVRVVGEDACAQADHDFPCRVDDGEEDERDAGDGGGTTSEPAEEHEGGEDEKREREKQGDVDENPVVHDRPDALVDRVALVVRMYQQHAREHERRHRDERTSEKDAHGVFPFLSSASSKNPTTRRSYSPGLASIPPVCAAPGTFQIAFGWPAASKYFGCLVCSPPMPGSA